MPINRVVLESQGTERLFSIRGESTGATITADLRAGGEITRQGPRAMELLSMGLAACMSAVTMSLLEKKRIAYESIRLEVEADRSEEGATEFRSIHLKVIVQGANLSQEELQKVIDLAGKHCPAHVTLSHGVPITAQAVALPASE